MRTQFTEDMEYLEGRIYPQDILDKVPKGDFIAVFGTSHSYGRCENIENSIDVDLLDENDMWVFSLGKKLGLEVFNISTCGNYNINMVRQMIDFFELPEEVTSRCKLIIAEPRVGDTAGIMCTDIIEEPDVSDEILNKVITNSYAFMELGKSRYIWENTLNAQFTNPISERISTEAYARRLINNVGHYEDDICPPLVLKNVTNYIDNHMYTSSISMAPLLRDFDNIRTMTQIAKMAKIPFMWFCFDSHWVLDIEDRNLCENVFMKTSDIFDARIPKLELGVSAEYELRFGTDKLQESACNCGHYNKTVNDWVADITHARIIELGYKL